MLPHKQQLCAAFLVSTLALSGCAPALFLGGAKAGATMAQERTVGAAIDDIGIQTNIEGKLAGESFELFRKVDVEVINGRVLMTGIVPTAEARVAAGRAAWSAPNVREVANELEIGKGGQIGSYFNDLRISEQLRAKLVTDRDVASINYNVETVNGTVYLLGIARTEAELERVALHARTIPGVKKVVSYIELTRKAAQPPAGT